MTQTHLQFTKELIKGKIAEIIFEQMIHDTSGYTILEFGYEKVVRQLAKEQRSKAANETIEIVRRAPDFAVINEKTHDISLIEVKYMRRVQKRWVLQIAKDIKQSWQKSCLFIGSPEGFYFDTVDNIIANEGGVSSFKHHMIPATTQKKYQELLNTFISA